MAIRFSIEDEFGNAECGWCSYEGMRKRLASLREENPNKVYWVVRKNSNGERMVF